MTATATKTGLVAGRIIEENYKHLKAVDVCLDGNHLVLSGQNGTGKSSFLDGFFETIAGYSKKTTPEPIRRGATAAHVRVELLDQQTRQVKYIVERHWTEKQTRVTVSSPDGSQHKKELLDGFLDEYTLNPSNS
jgi:recombinational DNA repair ATPase RecF